MPYRPSKFCLHVIQWIQQCCAKVNDSQIITNIQLCPIVSNCDNNEHKRQKSQPRKPPPMITVMSRALNHEGGDYIFLLILRLLRNEYTLFFLDHRRKNTARGCMDADETATHVGRVFTAWYTNTTQGCERASTSIGRKLRVLSIPLVTNSFLNLLGYQFKELNC